MTTPAELVTTAPAPSHGVPISSRQMQYGPGDWRIALEVADPGQGSSIEWHSFPMNAVARIMWTRGATEPRGRYAATTPTVEVWADGDRFAPWNDDTSDVFGMHVPLEAGLIMRYSVFRVVSAATNLWFPQWIGRVRRWRDQQTSPRDGWRVHRVDIIDLISELVPKPIPALTVNGWKGRYDAIESAAGWAFGSEVYAAETEDDGGGAEPTLEIVDREAQISAHAEIQAVLDPVGLVVRTHKRGSLLVHPPPWDTFHAGKFADGGLTIVGDEWVNPLIAYYPGGVRFSHLPFDTEVGYYPVTGGESFGLDSDIEAVVNELEVTFPDGMGGTDVYAYDDPVSAGRFGQRPMSSRSWLAQNDEVVRSIVDAQAYTHYVAAPIRTSLDEPGAFPALMLLDHLDPIEVHHATGRKTKVVTAAGSLRSIAHDVQPRTDETVEWDVTITFDVDTKVVTAALNPVENLHVTNLMHEQVEFAWTNPAQTITPTGVQVRVPQVSTQWLDYPYPIATFMWLGLPPTSTFSFDVRLIREVDGTVVAVSDVRSVTFTTPTPTTPTPPPGGGGGGAVVVVPPPDPGCSLEWKLSESDDNGETWTVVRTGDQDDLIYDAGTDTYTLDNSDYEYLDGHIYEQCVREVCGGEPGEWQCQSAPFNPLCSTPATLGDPPFDDANLVMFVPKVCENEIVEAVTETVGSKGPAFAGFGLTDSGQYTLTTASESNVVAYGDAPNVPLEDGDRSIHWRGVLGDVEELDPLLRVGRLRLIVIDVGSGVHKFAAVKSFAGGSITAIGTTTVAADTEYDVYATWDRSTATVAIFVDGSEEDSAEDAASYVNTPNLPTYSAKLPANSWATELAAWSSLVTVSFPPTLVATHTDSSMVNCRALVVRNNSGTIHLAVSSAPTTDKVSFWNVTNPASISSVAAALTVIGCADLYMTNATTMFVTASRSGDDGVYRINTWSSTPSLSTLLDSADMEGIAGIARNGTFNRIYIAGATSDKIVVATTASPPVYTYSLSSSNLNGATGVVEVDVSGTIYLVCAAKDADRVNVIETSSIDAPTITGSVTHANLDGCIRLCSIGSSRVAVLSPGAPAVTIIDISTPSSPSIVGTVTDATYLPNSCSDIAFDGTYVMVTDPANDRVVSIDVSTPTSPYVRGHLQDATNLDGVNRVVGLSGAFYATVPGINGFAILTA